MAKGRKQSRGAYVVKTVQYTSTSQLGQVGSREEATTHVRQGKRSGVVFNRSTSGSCAGGSAANELRCERKRCA